MKTTNSIMAKNNQILKNLALIFNCIDFLLYFYRVIVCENNSVVGKKPPQKGHPQNFITDLHLLSSLEIPFNEFFQQPNPKILQFSQYSSIHHLDPKIMPKIFQFS